MQSDNWRDSIADDRVRKTLKGCEDYAKDPYGDVAHNLKLLVAQLAKLLDEKEAQDK